jgi:hypothetical protein
VQPSAGHYPPRTACKFFLKLKGRSTAVSYKKKKKKKKKKKHANPYKVVITKDKRLKTP